MESIGQQLRHERELRQLSLAEISRTTRISVRVLKLIEDDRFDELPGEVFAKGFLRAYARAVGADDSDIVRSYERQSCPEATPVPLAAAAPPERGRRFGIAIALVILVILFTLALSVVLRPRHRNAPIELSRGPTPGAAQRQGSASERAPRISSRDHGQDPGPTASSRRLRRS
ncbi:MAG: helix-turn-helix domain-containing protein [Proteobacteria bacterium]|nr:helix-turn-helix domain-containing protein [Pseudomonadota bacterium]